MSKCLSVKEKDILIGIRGIFKNENMLFFTLCFLSLFFVSELVHAKDFGASIDTGKSELINIAKKMGPVSLIIAGIIFYFNRRAGTGLLLSSMIAIAIFASADTLFAMMFRIFS